LGEEDYNGWWTGTDTADAAPAEVLSVPRLYLSVPRLYLSVPRLYLSVPRLYPL
jgi:hypothetical protein